MDKIFEKKQYIVSSTFGVCRVEKITKLVAGKEQQLEYYVLQSLAEPNKRSYVPVENRETVLRVPMEAEEAKALWTDLMEGTLEVEENAVYTYDMGKAVLESGDPIRWGKAVCFLRKRKGSLDVQLEDVLEKIWKNLREELAFVLNISQEEIKATVENLGEQ